MRHSAGMLRTEKAEWEWQDMGFAIEEKGNN